MAFRVVTLMRDADVFTLADRAANRRPLPPCEADVCGECAHEAHELGDCGEALYDRQNQPVKCRCEGGVT